MRGGAGLRGSFDTGGDVPMTAEVISKMVMLGVGASLLVTVPVVLCGYMFRLLHIIS